MTQKCLYPTNSERQNVKLMLKVFDRRNVVALSSFGPQWGVDVDGTCKFLTIIVNLWQIVNNKHPLKHLRLRDPSCKPIQSMNDDNIVFMIKVLQWLREWKN